MLIDILKHAAFNLKYPPVRNPDDLPQVERQYGFWNHADIEWLADQVPEVPGDFGEIGVFRGLAFRKAARLAHAQGKMAHAFDSFRGMGKPGEKDGDFFPEGKFDVGGTEGFAKLMDEAGVPRDYYRMWPGFIPDCFKTAPADLRFSFCILDVDHYEPTRVALPWIAPRINIGGILALDDYIRRYDGLAAKAINEFRRSTRDFEPIAEFNRQLILRRIR